MAAAASGAPAGAGTGVPRDRADLLARSWTDAAELYLQELVPRFDPWLQSALRELMQHSLPPGPVVVPCCGPGHELVLLYRMYGGRREVYGLDLSPGMVDLARTAIRQAAAAEAAVVVVEDAEAAQKEEVPAVACEGASAPLEAVVADASCLDDYGPAAAVMSVFGLQQMGPAAPQALSSWVRSLAPGGVAVVVMWPSRADPGGPWDAFDQVVSERAAEVSGKPPPLPPPSPQGSAAAAAATATGAAPPAVPEWEARLTESVLRDVSGSELLVDRLEQYDVMWRSAEQLWQVMTYGGPWRARRLAQGDQVMADLEARFLTKMRRAAAAAAAAVEDVAQGSNGEGGGGATGTQHRKQPLIQRPFARMIVIRRNGEGDGSSSGAEPAAAAAGSGARRPQSAL